jgi:hypothetical protein
MLELLQNGAALLVEAILLAEALIDCGALAYASASAIAAIALFVVTSQADAESADGIFVTDEVVEASDDRTQSRRPRSLADPRDYYLSPRFVFGDNLYILPTPYPLLAQKSESTTGDAGLPTLAPPSNSNAAAPTNEAVSQEELPAGAEQPAKEKPATEFENEFKKIEAEDKKKEQKKPLIPDLAKGILIASNDGDLTFKPGLRMTPRYNNDMFIRRFRLKGSGSAYGVAKYGAEIKIDNTGRFEVNPTAIVENAWLDFPVVEDEVYFRAGRFDIPMSRNELTSDSKLLLMDRTLIKEALTAVGMADKQYGVMLHGRPDCGSWEYDVGIFDSNVYEKLSPADTRQTDQLMPSARVTYSFLDRPTALDGYADYWESYIGKGQRLDVAFNTAYLGGITDGLREFNQTGIGTDLFFNTGPYTFQAEYDWIFQNSDNATPDALIRGWYAQWGYLIDYWCEKPSTEFAVRYQTLDSDLLPETLRWTSVGFNFYIREHNLKVQTDYTFRQGDSGTLFTMMQENVFQVQLQLDF